MEPSTSVVTISNLLWGLSLVVVGLAAFFLSIGFFNILRSISGELQEENKGLIAALQAVILRRLGTINTKFMPPSYAASMRRKLITAGDPNGMRPEEVMALQEVGAVLGFIFVAACVLMLDKPLAIAFLGAVFGAVYPNIWVNDLIQKRHYLITRALPYNLDLLTLSVEAGLDFTGALSKVVEKGKGGPLRDEFMLVLKQLKMGKTREEALKSMIVRVDLPALTSFVAAIIQADKMGTSIGKVLRIQSTQLRIERSQRAEKLANEAPVKMLFPLIACIFPTVFMVLFGPIIFALMFSDSLG